VVDQQYEETKKASEVILAEDKKFLDQAAKDAQKQEDERYKEATKANEDARKAAEKEASDSFKAQLTEEQNAVKAHYKALSDLLNYNQTQETAAFKEYWDARFKEFKDSDAFYKQSQVEAQRAWLESIVRMNEQARALVNPDDVFRGETGVGPITTGLAAGGNAWAGQEYIVGENGPERFRPRVSGVIDANRAQNTRTSGGNTYNITYIRGDQEEDRVLSDVRLLQALEANL